MKDGYDLMLSELRRTITHGTTGYYLGKINANGTQDTFVKHLFKKIASMGVTALTNVWRSFIDCF